MLIEFGFWLCLGVGAYVYAGYPLALFFVSRFLARPVVKGDVLPRVTVIISAYNEEAVIQGTVLNKLQQDYPAELLDVVVISDGSTDRTDALVSELADVSPVRVTLLRQNPRQGKTQALNAAVPRALGEIIVFSDANSMYAPTAVRALVRNFADPSVGYVTGHMTYMNPDSSGIGEGTGRYMDYENILRSLETQVGSVVGVDGGVDAVRKALFVPMRADQLPDFVLPLNVVEQGKRVVYEPDALLYEEALSNPNDEFRMRVRVALRALWALWDKRVLFNPFRFPLFSWQLASHKLFRYAAFVPLMGVFFFSLLLLGSHPFYSLFFGAQILMLLAALGGHFFRNTALRQPKLLTPYYFLVLNAACLIAFWKFINRQKIVVWKPRTGV